MAVKNKKNLLKTKDEYNRYYGDFRGVDFSSDHTRVHEQRLAYSVNMYKDYNSGQGAALETIPGFRKRLVLPGNPKIYGIHEYKLTRDDETQGTKILVHAGTCLYEWYNYPNTIGVEFDVCKELGEPEKINYKTYKFKIQLGDNVEQIKEVKTVAGEDVFTFEYEVNTHILTITSSFLGKGDVVRIKFLEGSLPKTYEDELSGKTITDNPLFNEMAERKSTSFIYNNRLYIIDGKNYLFYDGTIKNIMEEIYHDLMFSDLKQTRAYVPTTRINIIPGGENADNGIEYEPRNFIQPVFRNTFIADGETREYCLSEAEIEGLLDVQVYGQQCKDYDVDCSKGMITFNEAPAAPGTKGTLAENFPENYAGVEITARKECDSSAITKCTIATVFDDRVFLSGNPEKPTMVYFCYRNEKTGHTDPTYFPVNHYQPDGWDNIPITGFLTVSNTLVALKNDTCWSGAVYYHTPSSTGDNLYPKIYPSSQGLSGIGCLGACVNFLDDPVFVSRLGVEAIGQLSVRLERALEHRSSLVDSMLVNMDLSSAVMEEWNGYLLLLVDGKIFMADSRQRFTHETGVMQYEWYYLEDIGVYDGQYTEYSYSAYLPNELKGAEVEYEGKTLLLEIAEELVGEVVNPPDKNGDETAIVDLGSYNDIDFYYTVYAQKKTYTDEIIGYKAYLCETKGNSTGGVFKKATILKTIDNNVFFGTENGVVCSFNFDKRNELGEIPAKYYDFDRRTILCGCATKMDNCGVPHLTKNTVKKSTVIKTKNMSKTTAKVKVRTNRKAFNQIARINSSIFSFTDVDFSNFSFLSDGQSLFSVREKEKKWVEKQFYVYSDEFRNPFSLHYIAFRYVIAGRYKE